MTILFLILGLLALGGGIYYFIRHKVVTAPQLPPLLPPSSLPQPAIAQAWRGLDDESDAATAKHAIFFHMAEFFNVYWEGRVGLPTTASITNQIDQSTVAAGLARRAQFKALNPNLLLGTGVGYTEGRDAYTDFPIDHPWWKRDVNGNRIQGWGDSWLFNLDLPEVRQHCAKGYAAVWNTGVWDFLFIDNGVDDANHVDILRRIRALIPDARLLINCNFNICPNICPLVDGIYMEDGVPRLDQWAAVEAAVDYNERHVRQPSMNVLELSGARTDLEAAARATCLALTKMNGYVLFSDPVTHYHTWFAMWNSQLGKPTAPPEPTPTGWRRQFEHGVAIYNPSGSSYLTMS